VTKQQEFLSCLTGKKCISCVFDKLDEGDLLLSFGSIAQRKSSKSDCVLHVRCKWRLRNRNRIVAAHADLDVKRTQRALSLIKGATLKHVEQSAISYDVKLSFRGGISIETFSNSLMYEQWSLRKADGTEYVIGPGLIPLIIDKATLHERGNPHSPD
jgi:hypothetical protein